jgi:hypothetical protein
MYKTPKQEMEVEIKLGGRDPRSSPVAEDLNDLEMEDDDLYASMAPKGVFTSRGLTPLVKVTNKMLPLFGQSPDYPTLSDTKQLPTDFTRILAMFVNAVSDAIQEEVLSPEMAINLDTVRDDTGLMSLAGKLDMLSKDRGFKMFLKEEAPMKEEAAPMEEDATMSMEDEDAFMMERMK